MKQRLPHHPNAPEPGAIVAMRFGAADVLAAVVENRGQVGRSGRTILRVQFRLNDGSDEIEGEVPAEDVTVVATPSSPASSRVFSEQVSNAWIGEYLAPDGRVAVVTERMPSKEAAEMAAGRWVKSAEADQRDQRFVWIPDPTYPGRHAVYRDGRLGRQLVREG